MPDNFLDELSKGFGRARADKQCGNSLFLLAAAAVLLGASPLGARQASIETNCGCSGYTLGGGAFVVPVLAGPLVNGRVSSGWGWRLHPVRRRVAFHFGVDIGAPRHAPLYAASGGVVEEARWKGARGNWLLVRYGKGLEVGYAHLDAFGAGVRAGAPVKRGEVIGFVGSTGLSTGPHVHVEMFVRGRRVKPLCVCYALARGREVKD
jgi:murein DD-endopeptidase MepM/ murein hydrolase activator NlpD